MGVVDLTHFRVRKQIPLDDAPAAVVAHPTAPKVFVLAPDAGTVYEIDVVTLAVSRRARVANQAVGMQVSPGRDALWVLASDPATLIELPFASMKPARRIRLSAAPSDFDLSSEEASGHRAVIASRDARTITIASLDSAAVERTIAAETEPSLVRFRQDAKQLIAGSQTERSLTIFDVPTGKTVVQLPLPLEPRHFCFTADGGQLFISGEGMDAVVIVYPYQTEVAATVLAGHTPAAMAITAPPAYLLVANPDTNSVTVLNVDIDTGHLAASVQVGQEPRYILVTPDNQYALVLNEKSGDMAVLRIFSLAPRRYHPTPLFTMIPVGQKPVSAAVVAL